MTRGGLIGVSRGESYLCLVLGDKYGSFLVVGMAIYWSILSLWCFLSAAPGSYS